jgi:putative PIN family toxin of toxin-antitoxin system
VRAVLDTDVVVSSVINRTGQPIRFIELAQAKRFDVIVSDDVLNEYITVLQRPKLQRQHGNESSSIALVVMDLFTLAWHVSPMESIRIVADDPKDDKFVEAAVAGGADFIVSGDRHLPALGSYEGIQIVTPALFVAFLERESPEML